MKNKTRQDQEYRRYVINSLRSMSRKPSLTNQRQSYIKSFYHSSTLDKFRNNQAKKKYKEHCTINIPKSFSFFSDPEMACSPIKTLIDFINKYRRIEHLIINYDKMKHYDLPTEALLDALVVELEKEQKPFGDFRVSGKYPKKMSAIRFLKAIGLVQALKMPRGTLAKSEQKKCKIFIKKSDKVKVNTSRVGNTDFDNVGTLFIDYINECLNEIDRELTFEGSRDLYLCVSEVLDNIREHSGEETWDFLAYLDTNGNKTEFTCEIVILNFGNTIADTFKKDDIFNKKAMNSYVARHSLSYSDDTLQTIFALQQNISSKNMSQSDSRGQGTIELIEFFQNLHNDMRESCCGNSDCKMILLSGRTLICFDSSCRLEKDEAGRKIIAFNEKNSLGIKPDKKFITEMQKFTLPGTLIGMRFALPKAMVRDA